MFQLVQLPCYKSDVADADFHQEYGDKQRKTAFLVTISFPYNIKVVGVFLLVLRKWVVITF